MLNVKWSSFIQHSTLTIQHSPPLPTYHRNHRGGTRHPREPVAESYIRRHRMSRLEIGVDDPLPVHGQLLDHAAARIDECGDTGGSRAKEVAIVLHGAQAGLIEVLPRCGGAVVPRVVGDGHQHVGAVHDLLPRDLRIDDLVADGWTVAKLAVERRVLHAELELPHLVDELAREEEHLAQRDVLAERNEADLVVVSDGAAAA